MWSRAWAFLRDESNHALVGWIVGGLAAAAAGIWAVFAFNADQSRPTPPPPSIEVHGGNVTGTGPNAGESDSDAWSPQVTAVEREADGLREADLRQEARRALAAEKRRQERAARVKILETGYSLLKGIGGEELGYGLYSYAILVNNNDRSAKFLDKVLKAIPAVEGTGTQSFQTNIFYIPLKATQDRLPLNFAGVKYELIMTYYTSGDDYAKYFYDYNMSRTLLSHLCDSPAQEIKSVCEGDLSRGPYIFAYAKPASNVTPVPPPFLFMELSDVHERAFPEIIAAFKAQVKREDISDGARINTLRLKVLSITLTAADWLTPVQKALADIVHSASGQAETNKK